MSRLPIVDASVGAPAGGASSLHGGSHGGSPSETALQAQAQSAERCELPTVKALEALWNEINEKPLYASPYFWRYLKLLRRSRLTPIDLSTCDDVVPQHKVNDCSSCTDICCIGPRSTVLLRLTDIATLIDIDRTELMVQKKPILDHATLHSSGAIRRQVGGRSWSTFPVLKQNSFSACEALDMDGKCTLYPHWPLACARFPYSLHADEPEIFYSSRCDSFWVRTDDDAKNTAQAMKVKAVAAYNERIKDIVLLEYAHDRLEDLGLLKFLNDAS